MKRKLAGAVLLFLCFAALAVPTGAVPAVFVPSAQEAESRPPSALPAVVTPERSTPAPAETEAPAETPVPAETEAPADAAVPFYEPEDAPAPEDAEQGIVAVTIESDELLQNDTYYNIDTEALLAAGPGLTLPREGYQILIVHTHATEAYAWDPDDPYEATGDCRTEDPAHSVVRVGEELADALSAYGLNVLHCTTLFDAEGYNGSYARSGAAIEEYLAAYPGIRVVIDLHRDALGDGDTVYKTVANIDGVYAAQLMLVMGSDVNLEHPAWQGNLRLALALQQAANARFGTLMRPVSLCSSRYNQQLAPGSFLLEAGTSGNTLDEALCAVRLFAETAGPLLAGLVED